MPFVIKKENAVVNQQEISGFNLSFYERVPLELCGELCALHCLAKSEIPQEIINLPIDTLQNPPIFWDDSLRFCLIQNENSIIGYGVGHKSYTYNDTYYVSVIYISPEYRGLGLSKMILNRFIQHFVESENYTELHAVTQPNNLAAIKLLEEKQFQYRKV